MSRLRNEWTPDFDEIDHDYEMSERELLIREARTRLYDARIGSTEYYEALDELTALRGC